MAERFSAAVFLSCFDDQGMKLIKKGRVIREMVRKQGLQFVIVGLLVSHAMASQNTMGIGVDNEHRSVARIKKNTIGGFGTNAIHRKEFLWHGRQRICG